MAHQAAGENEGAIARRERAAADDAARCDEHGDAGGDAAGQRETGAHLQRGAGIESGAESLVGAAADELQGAAGENAGAAAAAGDRDLKAALADGRRKAATSGVDDLGPAALHDRIADDGTARELERAAADDPGAAYAADIPVAADNAEAGEAAILRADRIEVERIGPGPAKPEGIVAGGFDVAADDIAGAKCERVAASAELDCSAAGADDGSGVKHAGGLDTDQCDTGRARITGVADVACRSN